MSDVFRIFGIELSPYSMKARSYFRYKQIPHEWIPRDAATMAEFQKYAKLPLVPLVVTPEDEGLQDSTPILEKMERRFPDPSIYPDDPVTAFVSALLEEFGDEWGNKWMFHLRWARPADQDSAALRIVRGMLPGKSEEEYAGMAEGLKARMLGRVWFVGSNDVTGPQIEASFDASMQQLEAHLASRPYLFGARPAFGDFGLWGQVHNAWTDPTAGDLLNAGMPHVVAWVERMLDPKAEGDFEPWSALEPTLAPLLQEQVGALFLPWSAANAEAVATSQEEFSVELASGTWTQKPQKYHARSLAALRKKYGEIVDPSEVDALLERTGCLAVLRG